MRVITNLHKEEGFTESDGWELKVWHRELTIKNAKCVNVTNEHKVNYLISKEEHGGAGIVELVHGVEVRNLSDVHEVNNCKILHIICHVA